MTVHETQQSALEQRLQAGACTSGHQKICLPQPVRSPGHFHQQLVCTSNFKIFVIIRGWMLFLCRTSVVQIFGKSRYVRLCPGSQRPPSDLTTLQDNTHHNSSLHRGDRVKVARDNWVENQEWAPRISQRHTLLNTQATSRATVLSLRVLSFFSSQPLSSSRPVENNALCHKSHLCCKLPMQRSQT